LTPHFERSSSCVLPHDELTGNLLPITYTAPPMLDEEDEAPVTRTSEAESTGKGKRKAAQLDEDALDS